MSLNISVESVNITERAIIESALPKGYRISSVCGGDHFVRNAAGVYVGFVYISERRVIFAFDVSCASDHFRKAVIEKYPECDPDRVVWGVFCDWHGMKSMLRGWSHSREEAISRIDEYVRRASNPVLCSFRAGDVIGMVFLSLTSFKLLANGEFSDQDDGPVVIELTNLEGSFSE